MRTNGRLPPDLNGSAAMTTVPRSYTLKLRFVGRVFDPLVDVLLAEAVVERVHAVIHGRVGGEVVIVAERPVMVDVANEVALFESVEDHPNAAALDIGRLVDFFRRESLFGIFRQELHDGVSVRSRREFQTVLAVVFVLLNVDGHGCVTLM